MAYCRWSSVTEEGKKSDVYVYESECGFEIHVSRSHINNPDDDPCPVFSLESDSYDEFALRHGEWEARNMPNTVHDFPHAGESYVLETPGECAALLEILRADRLHVPLYAINMLKLEEESLV